MPTDTPPTTDLGRLKQARDLGPSGEGRRRRQAARLSLYDVAPAVGVAPSTLARWEVDGFRPRPAGALRWLDALETLEAV